MQLYRILGVLGVFYMIIYGAVLVVTLNVTHAVRERSDRHAWIEDRQVEFVWWGTWIASAVYAISVVAAVIGAYRLSYSKMLLGYQVVRVRTDPGE
jgi:ABC-type Fe3+ transport system permease subunit